ncbi:hypothetical protein BLA29_010990, partial [Euroglyphus maynei]
CQITCSSSGQGYLILGDNLGLISFVTRQHSISSFTAYKIAVTHCASIKTTSTTGSSKVSLKSNFYLITVGTDNEDLIPILKIWAINEGFILAAKTQSSNVHEQSTSESGNTTSSTANPLAQCIRTLKLSCHNSTISQLSALRVHSMVTALDVLGDSMLAVGFNDGHCLLIKGELIRDRDRNLRIKLLEVSQND